MRKPVRKCWIVQQYLASKLKSGSVEGKINLSATGTCYESTTYEGAMTWISQQKPDDDVRYTVIETIWPAGN